LRDCAISSFRTRMYLSMHCAISAAWRERESWGSIHLCCQQRSAQIFVDHSLHALQAHGATRPVCGRHWYATATTAYHHGGGSVEQCLDLIDLDDGLRFGRWNHSAEMLTVRCARKQHQCALAWCGAADARECRGRGVSLRAIDQPSSAALASASALAGAQSRRAHAFVCVCLRHAYMHGRRHLPIQLTAGAESGPG
jgi:hypothetical protein